MIQTLNNFFKKLINNYQTAKAIRSTENELRKLTDKELNDIGIARGDIYAIARQDLEMRRPIMDAPYGAPFNPNLKGFI
jgi:uncharacterized protein YjiS (DUF1127 family)